MRQKIAIFSMLVLIGSFSGFNAFAEDAITTSEHASGVNSITLKALSNNKVEWSVEGYSKGGFKVVWSKNQSPTYPLRDGDKYHYYENPSYRYDVIDNAFAGEGTYYVRVCEYLDGACGVYSNEVSIELSKPVKQNAPIVEKNNMENKNNIGNDSSGDSIKEGNQIPSGYEKIPNLESIYLYSNIKKIGDSLYGIKAEATIPSNYQKISKIEDIKYYKNIKRIGGSLYGIRIADEKKKQIQTKIDGLTAQIKKIQDQINELTNQLNSIN